MNENKVLYKIKSLESAIVRQLETDIDEKIKVRQSLPTFTQLRIIEYILKHEKESIYQKDLEKVLNLRRATVSGVLQTMEKNNLIKREISDDDARAKEILLNDDAKNMFLKRKNKIEEMEGQVISGLSHEEITIFSQVLDKMCNNINRL